MNTQMEFGHWHDFYWIVIPIGIFAIAYIGYRKKRVIMDWLGLKINRSLMMVKGFLMIVGLVLVFISALGPEKEIGSREVESEGLDIYVLMDTSKSMLAEDALPSRLEQGKKTVEELLGKLKGDRIGFIPYASSAYIQMPLTDDYDLAKMYLKVVDTDMVGGGGTDIAQALSLAKASFDGSNATNRAIILISDGEEESADKEKIKQDLDDMKVPVFTIGTGTVEGSLIPLYNETGSKVNEYKKDASGNLVMTALDEDMLQFLANYSGGKYYHSDNGLSEIDSLVSDLSRLDKGLTTSRKVKEYKQYYQWFLGFGILALLIGFTLPDRRNAL